MSTRVGALQCPGCGFRNQKDARHCARCGERLDPTQTLVNDFPEPLAGRPEANRAEVAASAPPAPVKTPVAPPQRESKNEPQSAAVKSDSELRNIGASLHQSERPKSEVLREGTDSGAPPGMDVLEPKAPRPGKPAEGVLFEGKYYLTRRLGTGGMGAVYGGEDIRLKRPVALKVLHPSVASTPGFRERFEREARSQAQFTHSNIVVLYDSGIAHDGRPYMVMEYIDGTPLDQVLRETGALPLARATSLFSQICGGVEAAHRKGIMHRDLKPQNIMIKKDEQGREVVKILDLGLAKMVADASAIVEGLGGRVTQVGTVMGTPRYMSPEQATASPEVDHRTDVYSLGMILFEMVTGELPFKAETARQWIAKHITETPPPPSRARPELKLPKALDEVVLKAVAKAPEARWPSAAALAAAAAEAAGASLAPAAAGLPRRVKVLVAGLVLALLGAAVYGYFLFQRSQWEEKGDTLAAEKCYTEAIAAYRKALEFAVGADRPRLKQKIAAWEWERERERIKLEEEGDTAADEERDRGAIAAYRKALKFAVGTDKTRLEQKIANSQRRLDKNFRDWVESGDGAVRESRFGDAVSCYLKAEKYVHRPKQEKEIKDKLSQTLALWDAAFRQLLQECRQKRDQEDYDSAQALLDRAKRFVPDPKFLESFVGHNLLDLAKQYVPDPKILNPEDQMLETCRQRSYNTRLSEAETAEKERDYRTALKKYREALRFTSERSNRKTLEAKIGEVEEELIRQEKFRTNYELAQEKEKESKLSEAIELYKIALTFAPPKKRAGIQDKVRDLQKELEKQTNEALVKQYEEDIKAMRTALQEGDMATAEDKLKAAGKHFILDQKRFEEAFRKAVAELRSHQPDKALLHFQEASQAQSQPGYLEEARYFWGEVLYGRAQQAEKENRPGEALEIYDVLVESAGGTRKAGAQSAVARLRQVCPLPNGENVAFVPMKAEPDYQGARPVPEMYVGKYEITIAQYKAFFPDYVKEDWRDLRAADGEQHPVVNISFTDAQAFCRKLTAWAREKGQLPKNEVCRLPYEAEWVKAAGWDAAKRRLRPWPWGETAPTADNKLCSFSGYDEDQENRHKRETLLADGWENTAPVGRFKSDVSFYGCFDMGGNVCEWCLPDTTPENVGVARGGSYDDNAYDCKLAQRKVWPAFKRLPQIGFRIIRAQK